MTRRIARRLGFSLVELLVVIGVVVLLAGLTVAIFPAINERADINATTQTIRMLDLALDEWEAQSGRRLSWGIDGQPFATSAYDMQANRPHVLTMNDLLRTIGGVEAVESILLQIEPNLLYRFDEENAVPLWISRARELDPWDGIVNASPINFADLDGQLTILDRWGQPIRAIHPGRVANNVDFSDNLNEANVDGTVYLDKKTVGGVQFPGTESAYGIAVDQRVYFVSAGPDGRFGDLSAPPGDSEGHYELAEDNIYSYDVVRPPQP